jgi:hypothetical protein
LYLLACGNGIGLGGANECIFLSFLELGTQILPVRLAFGVRDEIALLIGGVWVGWLLDISSNHT